MVIYFDAPVSPDALTAFIREVPLPAGDTLTPLFDTEFSDTNTIDWSEVISTNRTARFRSFDGRIHVSDRDALTDKRVNMLPLSDSLNMGEYERLQVEFARTGGTRTGALTNAVYNDGQRLTNNVRNRMRQAVGDVVTDGKLTINENGLVGFEADFGVPGGHLITAGTLWTNTAAAALDLLISSVDTYVAANGYAPGAILTSNRVRRSMQVNTQLINAAVGSAAGRSRIDREEIAGVLDSEGLPSTIITCDDVVDVDGVTTRVIPDDRLVFLPPDPRDLLAIRYGLTATALELVGSNLAELAFEDAPGIVGVVEKVGPPYRQFTFVDAVGMPYLKDARRLMVLDVL